MATVTIDWGDSTPNTVLTKSNVSGEQDNIDLGSHTYAAAGAYQVAVTWNQGGGVSASTEITVNVLAAPGALPFKLTARESSSAYAFRAG